MIRFSSNTRKVVALAMAVVVLGAMAPRTEASTVYAFSQQKVYNMTLTGTQNPAGLVGAPLNVRTSTAATLNGVGVAFNVPAQDAQQSVLGIAPPPENMSGPNPTGGAGNTTVLIQADGTPAGLANTVTQNLPALGDLNQNSFTRSDVLMRVPPPAAGNLQVDPRWLFQPGFGAGNDTNLSLDSMAEGELTGSAQTGSATSNWTVSGSFVLGAPDAVQLMFNLIDRLVAFNNAQPGEIANADSNLTFSFDVKDNQGNSVFAGAPSYAHLASISFPPAAPTTGLTENDNTAAPVNTIQGVSFVTGVLAPGAYTFSINGKTNVDVSLVPEPASYVMMGLGVVAMGGLRLRRRMQAQRSAAE